MGSLQLSFVMVSKFLCLHKSKSTITTHFNIAINISPFAIKQSSPVQKWLQRLSRQSVAYHSHVFVHTVKLLHIISVATANNSFLGHLALYCNEWQSNWMHRVIAWKKNDASRLNFKIMLLFLKVTILWSMEICLSLPIGEGLLMTHCNSFSKYLLFFSFKVSLWNLWKSQINGMKKEHESSCTF